jgi:amino acid adenylation domain-containing protein
MTMLIHRMFEAQARRTPDVTALAGSEISYTYWELDERSNSIAAQLRQAGVRPETVVGCWSQSSVATVLQVLAVLKAGGAYLLLDPHLPADRLRYMINDADPLCILADSAPPESCSRGREVLVMTASETRSPATRVGPTDVSPDNLAYIAYTSGSTGRPKGVLITHAAVANHAAAFRAQFDLRPGDRLPLMAPIAFDMATEEMLPPLVSGCTLIDAPHRSPTMGQFTDDVLSSGYTILNIPAPLWHQWTSHLRESRTPVPPSLRLVIAGSDKIYTSKLDEWKALPGAERVWWVAAYGVTEATVTSLLYLTAAHDDLTNEPLVPVGRPLGNVTASAVHDDGSPVSPGETGELRIGGAGLARGYLNMPSKTHERFLHHTDGTRTYRTGDLVRQRPDGCFVWLGRQDSQIKINGLRIEPAEIEATIQQYPWVGEAIVVFSPPTAAGDRGTLTAYLQASGDTPIDTGSLTAFLADRLHPLMVPGHLVVLDSIPVNANGKIDRTALALHTFRQAS